MSSGDDLADVIADAVKDHVLGTEWRQRAHMYPLSAQGGKNEADHWWSTDNAHGKRRAGHPAITIWNKRSWVTTAICSPKGKNYTLYVPKEADIEVIEVEITK